METTDNKILFFTNTPPEYRIPLYQQMTQLYPVTFVFTRLELAKEIYGNDLDSDKMSQIRFAPLSNKKRILKDIKKLICEDGVQGVVVPPLDSLIETIYAYWIFFWVKKARKKTLYFWGKWEAPKNEQPVKKRVKNGFQRMVARVIIKRVDYNIGYGEKAREYLITNGANPLKCCTALYCSCSPICDKTDWKKQFGISENKKYILYFGRIIEKKGVRVLIDAMSMLNKSAREKLWLVIVGDGPDRFALKKYSNEKQIKNITWVGYVHPDMRFDYYSQCDIFVLPTSYYYGSVEAWGMTMNEAMQCGEILIATEAVGSAYELINEKNGYMVKAGDSKSLSAALMKSVEDRDLIKVQQENERLCSIYNYDSSSRRLISVFEKCLNQ